MKYLLVMFLFVCFLTACALQKKKKPQLSPPVSKKHIFGIISYVDKNSHYVLIRKYGSQHQSEDHILVVKTQGKDVKLIPTGEELGEHIAADLSKGSPKVGDIVWSYEKIKEKRDQEDN